MIVLSILIPTIIDRVQMFTALFNELHRQIEYMNTFHPTLGEIEILVDDSPKFLNGGLSIGKKRDALVKRAEGKYTVFIDDDEWPAPNYVESIVRLCHQDKDIITFCNISKMDNFWMVVQMSIHNDNEQARPGLIFRKPFHICPIRKTISEQFDFSDTNYGEDAEWMDRVLTAVTTEEHSEAILHEYRHGKHSEADKITNHLQNAI